MRRGLLAALALAVRADRLPAATRRPWQPHGGERPGRARRHGVEVRLPAEVRRIVTTVPGLTATVIEMGNGARLVGVSDQDSKLGALAGVPRIPVWPTIPAEVVAGLEPDLLLVDLTLSNRDLAVLRKRFPVTFATDSRTLAGVRLSFERIGEALGREVRARHLVEELDLARREAHVDGRPKVLLLTQTDPSTMVLGPGALLDDMLRAVGGVNVAWDLGRPSGDMPVETIRSRAPEWILLTGAVFTDALRERWASILAVRDGAVDPGPTSSSRPGRGRRRRCDAWRGSCPAGAAMRPAASARAPLGIALAAAFAAVAALVGLFSWPSHLAPGEVLAALFGGPVSDTTRDLVWIDRGPRVLLGFRRRGAGRGGDAVPGDPAQPASPTPTSSASGPAPRRGAEGALGVSQASLLGITGAGACAFLGGGGRGPCSGSGGRGLAVHARVLRASPSARSSPPSRRGRSTSRTRRGRRRSTGCSGRFAVADAARIRSAAVATGVLVALVCVRARDLDALALGEASARFGGVDAPRAVRWLAAAGCLLVAAAVSTAGLVGFVGLLVPHGARRLVGPAHRVLVPVAALLGAGLLVLADGVARATARVEVPVGVVTALLGAPVFAWLLRRSPRG
jgi:iron complex transport system permease protein